VTAKYDDASWHSDGVFPEDLPPEAGGTHIAMFLAWALLSGLGGPPFCEESPMWLDRLRRREITPNAYLEHEWDGKFLDDALGTDGNAFARAYYEPREGEAVSLYTTDYEEALGQGLPSLYHVPDSWAAYDVLKPVLDRRLAEWRESRKRPAVAKAPRPWWRFWGR
jgi:hypothetical protein